MRPQCYLSVPETVIKTVKDKIFKSVWKNLKDKVKTAVIYEPFSHCGVKVSRGYHCCGEETQDAKSITTSNKFFYNSVRQVSLSIAYVAFQASF